jgi:Prokaryotic phospholipase A2
MKQLLKNRLGAFRWTTVTTLTFISVLLSTNLNATKVFATSTNAVGYKTLSQNILKQVDYLVRLDANRFWQERTSHRGSYSSKLNWDTDFCSKSRDTGVSFDFRKPCAHHDFGYRNYKKLGRFDSTHKKLVDDIFYRDMRTHCQTRSIFLKPNCYSTALTYYKFVQRFGD